MFILQATGVTNFTTTSLVALKSDLHVQRTGL